MVCIALAFAPSRLIDHLGVYLRDDRRPISDGFMAGAAKQVELHDSGGEGEMIGCLVLDRLREQRRTSSPSAGGGARIERSGFHCNITTALTVTSQPIAMLPASLGCAPSISPPIYKVLSITGAGGREKVCEGAKLGIFLSAGDVGGRTTFSLFLLILLVCSSRKCPLTVHAKVPVLPNNALLVSLKIRCQNQTPCKCLKTVQNS